MASRGEFRERFATALRRRVVPLGPLSRRQIAHAIGVCDDTIDNWLAGRSQPDAWVMGLLMEFFDASFACEVYQPHGVAIVKLSDIRKVRSIAAVEKLAPVCAAIDALEGLAS